MADAAEVHAWAREIEIHGSGGIGQMKPAVLSNVGNGASEHNGFSAGLAQNRQQEGHQCSDDGDDNEEFNEGKGSSSRHKTCRRQDTSPSEDSTRFAEGGLYGSRRGRAMENQQSRSKRRTLAGGFGLASNSRI